MYFTASTDAPGDHRGASNLQACIAPAAAPAACISSTSSRGSGEVAQAPTADTHLTAANALLHAGGDSAARDTSRRPHTALSSRGAALLTLSSPAAAQALLFRPAVEPQWLETSSPELEPEHVAPMHARHADVLPAGSQSPGGTRDVDGRSGSPAMASSGPPGAFEQDLRWDARVHLVSHLPAALLLTLARGALDSSQWAQDRGLAAHGSCRQSGQGQRLEQLLQRLERVRRHEHLQQARAHVACMLGAHTTVAQVALRWYQLAGLFSG
jgi:hypothetical protein